MNQITSDQERINEMINSFFNAISKDPRISPTHVSLYMTLLHIWSIRALTGAFYIYSSEVMPLAKICGSATYHKTIRELSDYGYIRYVPSHNYLMGSLVLILEPPNPVW